jgi:hypothetical protein
MHGLGSGAVCAPHAAWGILTLSEDMKAKAAQRPFEIAPEKGYASALLRTVAL